MTNHQKIQFLLVVIFSSRKHSVASVQWWHDCSPDNTSKLWKTNPSWKTIEDDVCQPLFITNTSQESNICRKISLQGEVPTKCWHKGTKKPDFVSTESFLKKGGGPFLVSDVLIFTFPLALFLMSIKQSRKLRFKKLIHW